MADSGTESHPEAHISCAGEPVDWGHSSGVVGDSLLLLKFCTFLFIQVWISLSQPLTADERPSLINTHPFMLEHILVATQSHWFWVTSLGCNIIPIERHSSKNVSKLKQMPIVLKWECFETNRWVVGWSYSGTQEHLSLCYVSKTQHQLVWDFKGYTVQNLF